MASGYDPLEAAAHGYCIHIRTAIKLHGNQPDEEQGGSQRSATFL
jgi:hypothetical protein